MGFSRTIDIGRTLSWLTGSHRAALLFVVVAQVVHGEVWAQSSSTCTPAPLNGVIDLKGYQLEDGFTIPLNGDWFLTWDKLLTPKPWAVLKTGRPAHYPSPTGLLLPEKSVQR